MPGSRPTSSAATRVRAYAVTGASRSAAPTSWRASSPSRPASWVASITDANARCCNPSTRARTRSKAWIRSTRAAASRSFGSIPASRGKSSSPTRPCAHTRRKRLGHPDRNPDSSTSTRDATTCGGSNVEEDMTRT